MKQFLSAEHMQNNEHFQVRDDDPFTRKSARMKLVTGVTRVKSDAESLDISNGSVSLDSTLNLSGKPSILKNSSSVLPPPGDLFSAHGIDINIDLDKVLPATTTISLRAPPSASTSTSSLNQQRIPQKSSRTLTLEEYKRKYSSRMT